MPLNRSHVRFPITVKTVETGQATRKVTGREHRSISDSDEQE